MPASHTARIAVCRASDVAASAPKTDNKTQRRTEVNMGSHAVDISRMDSPVANGMFGESE